MPQAMGSAKMQEADQPMARGFQAFARYVGAPPFQFPSLSLVRVATPNTASAYFQAIAANPMIHIQNIAPGPPMAIALPTPIIFPVPMVLASVANMA